MDKKVVLFAFQGNVSCFVHVLLNAIDYREKGYEAKVVLEGEATKLVAELAKAAHPMHGLFEQTKALGLFAGACRACSHQLGSQEACLAEGLVLLDDMHGHPGMAGYTEQGYTILIF
ncbi:cytoplasmic protein [Desulfovibrio aerotolerans]|uniref:Cytoplasmic protein n=1 Tax=Solidesulfovibrio aerotolerans TaxID=295255 RepID=A0A7C9IRD2_9BACT|nr:cytoplasmic protein [Solidesulfovibrio aerotolerans]